MTKASPASRSFSVALTISGLNQALTSLISFGLALYLLRALSEHEFGLYGLAFAFVLLFAGACDALFHTQMVVHLPRKAPGSMPAYAARMLVLLGLFCMAIALSMTLGVALLYAIGVIPSSILSYIASLLGAALAFPLKDFFVRYAYNSNQEPRTLAVNAFLALSLAIPFGCLEAADVPLDVSAALWIVTLAHALAAVFGSAITGLRAQTIDPHLLRADAAEAWASGRWAALTNLVFFVRWHSHTIVATTLLGPSALASLNATRLLVTPAVMLTPALGHVAMPRMGQMKDRRLIEQAGSRLAAFLGGIACIYAVVLLAGYQRVVDLLFGAKYQGLIGLTTLWCVYTLLLGIRSGPEISQMVLRAFRPLFYMSCVAGAASLIGAYLLTVSYGLDGALYGLILGEAVMITLLLSVKPSSFKSD